MAFDIDNQVLRDRVNGLTVKGQQIYIKKDWRFIRFIENPSDKIKKYAITCSLGEAVYDLKHLLTEDEKVKLIKHYPYCIHYLNPADRTPKIIDAAIKRWTYAIMFLTSEEQTDSVQLTVLSDQISALKYIFHLCDAAVMWLIDKIKAKSVCIRYYGDNNDQ